MSLFGALSSGVSGLTSQSSAMGAISDNITNVSTIGYKNTRVDFKTLVTKQTSSTFYSAGGVQSSPRQDTGVQGLLQASTSSTDLSISGQGYFVVNEGAVPSINDQYMYTRAGSFFQDDQGYLRNTSGFYLQGWPTDAAGTVKPANDSLTIANQNIISTDYLETVNLNRVGGTATATTTIAIGANLPANDTAGTTHKTDVQFFDTLGNANTMSFIYTKGTRDNTWDLDLTPPPGTGVVTVEDGTVPTALVYSSTGQLEFNIPTTLGDTVRRPAHGATVIIDSITYRFDTSGAAPADTATLAQIDISTTTSLSQDVAALVAKVIASDTDFDTVNNRIQVSSGSSTTVLFKDDGAKAIVVDPTGLLDTSGSAITKQTSSLTAKKPDLAYTDYEQITFSANLTGGTITVHGYTYAAGTEFALGASLALTLANLEAAIEATDPSFAAGGSLIRLRTANGTATGGESANTLVLSSLKSGTYNLVLPAAAALGANATSPDGLVTFHGTTTAINTMSALNFTSDGLPQSFNVKKIEVLNFASGAANMDDGSSSADKMTIDFGNVLEANGMTQFGAAFSPTFITQNGSRFGTFAGVSVGVDGVMTALFDNGETRKIYKLPLATFVNVNQLGGNTGNVWNATQRSGDYTLREADNGPSGQIVQGALEASTVDIGEEFTKMIVVQRAYSASAKIISTADEMLAELMRIKG